MLNKLIPASLSSKLKSWSLLCIVAVTLMALLFVLVNLFSPLQVGPNGILGFFFLLYLLCATLTLMGFKAFRQLFKVRTSTIKLLYLSATISFAPVMLIALNTLNQLQLIDIVLVFIFELLALFYIFRRIE
jgi:hypothetical protein